MKVVNHTAIKMTSLSVGDDVIPAGGMKEYIKQLSKSDDFTGSFDGNDRINLQRVLVHPNFPFCSIV